MAQSDATIPAPPPQPQGVLSVPGSRRALSGFFVSGMLFALLGAILPSWGHHLQGDYATVGAYFFCVSIGVVISARATGWLLARKGTGFGLVVGCLVASGSLLYLAAVCPPAPAWARMIGLAGVGMACGLLHWAVFQGISSIYQHNPAATANLASGMFGAGCFVVTLLISGTFYVYTVPSVLILLAVIPALFAIMYSKVHYGPITREFRRPIRDVLSDLGSPAALLFAALLFFQFGNEWSVAGWLSLFLVQRLGISPTRSLLYLALYWLVLLLGRIVVQSLISRIRRPYLLFGSMFSAMFGCLILVLTDNPFGALTAVVFVGAGFAAIYPLVVQNIGSRFPNYHPGFYNGIFSVAVVGGLLAPGTLGYLASLAGVQVVMMLPFLGSIMVLILMVVIRVESRMER